MNHMSNEGLRARINIAWLDWFNSKKLFISEDSAKDFAADFAQQIREDDCNAICIRCRSGETTYLHPDGNIRHTQAGSICNAAAIRNLAEKEPKE